MANFEKEIKSPHNFGGRVSEALYALGYTDKQTQISALTKLCCVTIATASRYLRMDSCPFSKRLTKIINLADALNCNVRWLLEGVGLSPFQEAMRANMVHMTEYEKNKMFRLCIRMLNKDPKVDKAINLYQTGFISRGQFLASL